MSTNIIYIWEILGCAFGTLWHSAAGLIGFCGASVVIAAGLSNYESCNCQDRRFIERYRSGLKALTKMHSIDRTYQTASYIYAPWLPVFHLCTPPAQAHASIVAEDQSVVCCGSLPGKLRCIPPALCIPRALIMMKHYWFNIFKPFTMKEIFWARGWFVQVLVQVNHENIGSRDSHASLGNRGVGAASLLCPCTKGQFSPTKCSWFFAWCYEYMLRWYHIPMYKKDWGHCRLCYSYSS